MTPGRRCTTGRQGVLKLAATLGCVASLMLGLAGVAAAQDYPPPGVSSVTPSNPGPGSTVTITGTGAVGETITATLLDGNDGAALTAGGQAAGTVHLAAVRVLGSTTVDAAGQWSLTVTIPTDVVAPAFLQVAGSVSGVLVTVTIAQLTPVTPTTAAPGGGGVAFTGMSADTLVMLGVLLVVVGGLIVLTVRQRRRRQVPTSV